MTPRPVPETKPSQAGQWNGHICVDSVATSGPEPRAKLILTDGGVELSGTLGTFRFTPATVAQITRAGLYPWFWGGIRFRHKLPEYPKLIQFCPMGEKSRMLLERLRERGFPV